MWHMCSLNRMNRAGGSPDKVRSYNGARCLNRNFDAYVQNLYNSENQDGFRWPSMHFYIKVTYLFYEVSYSVYKIGGKKTSNDHHTKVQRYTHKRQRARHMFAVSTDQFPDPIKHQINNFLANGVVTPCIVVGCILLPSDQLLRVEQLPVRASSHFIYRSNGK